MALYFKKRVKGLFDKRRICSELKKFSISLLNDEERKAYYNIRWFDKYKALKKGFCFSSMLSFLSAHIFLLSQPGKFLIREEASYVGLLIPFVVISYYVVCSIAAYKFFIKKQNIFIIDESEMGEIDGYYKKYGNMSEHKRLCYINSSNTLLELVKTLRLRDEKTGFEDIRNLINQSYKYLSKSFNESDIYLAENLLEKSLNNISVLEQLIDIYSRSYVRV
jgi:hypothetical protein